MSARATLLRCAGAVASTSASGAWVAEQRCGVLPRVIVIVTEEPPLGPRAAPGGVARMHGGSHGWFAAVPSGGIGARLLDVDLAPSRVDAGRPLARHGNLARGPRPARGDRAPLGGFAVRALSTRSGDRDATSDAAPDAAADAGSSPSAEDSTVDPESLPPDDVLPPHLMRPSWLRKKRNRKEKGSYEGFITEIDTYEDFDPPGGNLYNVADFKAETIESSPAALDAFSRKYMDTQKALYAANGGEEGISDEEFLERYERDFEVSPEEEKRHILKWEVHMVHEAAGENDHPLNRKVTMRVNAKDLQRETGLSEEALQYVKDICGPRYDAKKDEIKIVCTRSRNREHNRQWCLKVLYDLIMEGNREFPGESYCFTPEGPVEPGTVGKQ